MSWRSARGAGRCKAFAHAFRRGGDGYRCAGAAFGAAALTATLAVAGVGAFKGGAAVVTEGSRLALHAGTVLKRAGPSLVSSLPLAVAITPNRIGAGVSAVAAAGVLAWFRWTPARFKFRAADLVMDKLSDGAKRNVRATGLLRTADDRFSTGFLVQTLPPDAGSTEVRALVACANHGVDGSTGTGFFVRNPSTDKLVAVRAEPVISDRALDVTFLEVTLPSIDGGWPVVPLSRRAPKFGERVYSSGYSHSLPDRMIDPDSREYLRKTHDSEYEPDGLAKWFSRGSTGFAMPPMPSRVKRDGVIGWVVRAALRYVRQSSAPGTSGAYLALHSSDVAVGLHHAGSRYFTVGYTTEIASIVRFLERLPGDRHPLIEALLENIVDED